MNFFEIQKIENFDYFFDWISGKFHGKKLLKSAEIFSE